MAVLWWGWLLGCAVAASAQDNSTEPATNEPPPGWRLLVLHGWVAGIAAMMLLPLGVVTMRFLPDLFGVSKGTTLSLHMTLFAMVVALQTVGLVAVVPYSSGEHPTHGVTGYICYSLLMVSVALGACSAFKHPLPLTREQVGTTPHRVVGILTAISGAVSCLTGKVH